MRDVGAAPRERSDPTPVQRTIDEADARSDGNANGAGAGSAAKELLPIDAVVVDDAAPGEPSVKVTINGQPAEYVPRDELAMWAGGAADDFGDNDWGFAADGW